MPFTKCAAGGDFELLAKTGKEELFYYRLLQLSVRIVSLQVDPLDNSADIKRKVVQQTQKAMDPLENAEAARVFFARIFKEVWQRRYAPQAVGCLALAIPPYEKSQHSFPRHLVYQQPRAVTVPAAKRPT